MSENKNSRQNPQFLHGSFGNLVWRKSTFAKMQWKFFTKQRLPSNFIWVDASERPAVRATNRVRDRNLLEYAGGFSEKPPGVCDSRYVNLFGDFVDTIRVTAALGIMGNPFLQTVHIKALSSQLCHHQQGLATGSCLFFAHWECLLQTGNSESKKRTGNACSKFRIVPNFKNKIYPRGFKKYDYLRLFTSIRNGNRTPVTRAWLSGLSVACRPTSGVRTFFRGKIVLLKIRLKLLCHI